VNGKTTARVALKQGELASLQEIGKADCIHLFLQSKTFYREARKEREGF
jgi:hypothetical protein